MALRSCNDVRGGNYCGVHKSEIDGDCHELDYQAGNKIIIQTPGDRSSRCYCVCSCLAVDTPVAISDGTINVQDIKAGKTTVLAAGLGLEWAPHVVGQWSVAAPGKSIDVIYMKYIVGETEEKEIIVTRDQLFLTLHGKLTPADKLAPRDQLTDRDGQPVQIKDIGWGSYDGNFYELATTMDPPDSNFSNHLIITNEVVTADFAVQMFQDAPRSHAFDLVGETRDRPSVGSPEWLEAHGFDDQTTAKTAADLNKNSRFTHADEHAVVVPDHASDFPLSHRELIGSLGPPTRIRRLPDDG